ncbi:hypothetical protein ABXS69_06415 [Actinomyces timonensis]|uniref:Uncharacterized protein n=1 Tax=Actinomyces timonensis TaxID=1288391 RepID=A0AAU8MZX2_9ACTO
MSRSLCRPGLEPPRAAMVLPAALGIVLTAGLGLGSIAVSPTAGADELGPKAAQTSEAVPAAVDGAKASTPRVNRPIDQIVDRSGGPVQEFADGPARDAGTAKATADSDDVDPAPAPMRARQVNNLRRETAAPSPAPSPTASPSPSASAEQAGSPSAAPSAPATASPSASPTASSSATAAGAADASPSATPSASPSASAAASPRAITGKPRVELGDGGSFSTTALAVKGSNWADAKGNALNGTINMTVALRGAGGAIDRQATIPVKMEDGAFSTTVDAESLFKLTTKDLVDNGRFRLRVSSPDGGRVETRLFFFVPGGAPAPRPTGAPTARPSTPAPTGGPTAPAPSADPKPAPTAEPTTAPTTRPAPPVPEPPAPEPSAPAPTAPAPSADPKPAPTAEPTTAPTTRPAPPVPEPPAPEPSAPEAPTPEASPTAGAPTAPGPLPEAPATDPAAPVAPPTIIATLPPAPAEEPTPERPEASSSASPSAQPTEPKPSDPPRSPVTDGSQLTADNAGSLSGGRQGDHVSLVLPKDKAKEGDWVAVFRYPGGKSAGWVQVDHSNSVKVDISNIDAGSHKLAIAGRDSQLLGWVQLEIARTDTVNTDLMEKANRGPVNEAVLGGDDWMLISAAGILTAGAAAYMFLARPRARRPVQ